MMSKTETRTLLNLTVNDLVSAYNGRSGKCACGCSGRHSYMDADLGTARRGYAVDADEVRPKSVARTLTKVQDHFDTAESFPGGFSVDVDGRLFAVYVR